MCVNTQFKHSVLLFSTYIRTLAREKADPKMEPAPGELHNLHKYLINLLIRLIDDYSSHIQKEQGSIEVIYRWKTWA